MKMVIVVDVWMYGGEWREVEEVGVMVHRT